MCSISTNLVKCVTVRKSFELMFSQKCFLLRAINIIVNCKYLIRVRLKSLVGKFLTRLRKLAVVKPDIWIKLCGTACIVMMINTFVSFKVR